MSRGKGGETVYSYPISLEPPFEPFQHAVSQPSIFDRLFQKTQRTSINPGIQRVQQRPFTAIQMRPSTEDKGGMPTAAHILTALRLKHPASFEIIGNQSFVAIQLAADPQDATSVIGVISSHHPHAEVFVGEDVLKKIFDGLRFVVRTYRLHESHFFPISIDIRSADPYQTLFGILGSIDKKEIGSLQVLFAPAQHDWKLNILKASQSEYDPSKSPFYDLDLPKIAEKKTAHPLFCCSIRLAGSSPHVIHQLEGFFNQFTGDNSLIQVSGNYPPSSVMNRTNHASGVILNTAELSALIHLPSSEAIMPPLIQARRTAAPPELARDPQGILFGENLHKGHLRPVAVSKDWLTRHVLALGATGSGKTIWQANFFKQFIQHHGAIYIDPSGDSAKEFLKLIPPHRVKDAIYLDPCDPEYAPAFNVLDMIAGGDIDLIKSSVLTAFRRLFAPEGIGPRSEYLLSHAISTILKSAHHPKTLLALPRLFTDKGFRSNVLASIGDTEISNFWRAEYSKLPESAILPLLNKLHTFLGHEKIRSMICQSGKIDLDEIIRKKKIVVINLAKGLLGESVAATLGFLFLSAIQQTVMGLAKIPPSERDYFALILDEAHLFLTHENADAVNSLLSESRKFKWVNVIGTQFLAQTDSKVRDALLGNVGTLHSFRLGIDDARILQKEFGSFTSDDLLNLMPGKAIVRIGRSQDSFNLETHRIDLEALPDEHGQEIIERSRELYYSPRKDIEKMYNTCLAISPVIDGQRTTTSLIASSETPSKSQQREKTQKAKESEPTQESNGLVIEEMSFLKFLSDNPAMFVTKAYKSLGLSGYKGDKLKESLIKKGHISQDETREGKMGRLAKVLSLTEEGLQALNIKRLSGKGGDTHKQLQQMIKEQSELYGWKARIEERIPGSLESVDVGLKKGEVSVAVEVSSTTKPDQEIQNIRKCLDAGYDYIVCVSSEEKSLALLKTEVKKSFMIKERERIRFCHPSRIKTFLSGIDSDRIVSEKPADSDIISNQKQLLGTREASEFLGIKRSTLYEWVVQKKIPYVKVGRLTKFRREDLEKWLKRRTQEEDRRGFI